MRYTLMLYALITFVFVTAIGSFFYSLWGQPGLTPEQLKTIGVLKHRMHNERVNQRACLEAYGPQTQALKVDNEYRCITARGENLEKP